MALSQGKGYLSVFVIMYYRIAVRKHYRRPVFCGQRGQLEGYPCFTAMQSMKDADKFLKTHCT